MYDSSLQVQGTKTEITCLLCSTNRLLIVMNDQRMLLLPHIDVNCIIEKSDIMISDLQEFYNIKQLSLHRIACNNPSQ